MFILTQAYTIKASAGRISAHRQKQIHREMRRNRKKGANKDKVFGCDLLAHLAATGQEIPHVLRSCSEFIEEHGIVDGIYRLSGVSSNIQKLRGEFESDGAPDLNKDVYLQDIHCVSSLCKAYFRELPNPLLTYQLYDKFAEAVAIQLEEERLVKIRDVLKELPPLHHRTLEFLMRHLVRMGSRSSETNMHARNLAIVWAPNLLRSKDIETMGFNGTAAFMEVRVQSIVVEFILTHVPQLFAEPGVSTGRRKSLPSPTAMTNPEDHFFRALPFQVPASYGNISPGDGPLPIIPYHAIIDGTDKRKNSLKGRKWRSIFNIGGRFHDPRRRNKNSTKEKEKPALRPAKSMDSLSAPSYPHEGSRHSTQRPPSTNLSPLVTSSPQMGAEPGAAVGSMGSSGYAVTFRRGTGIVSGSAGTQGTYSLLDPEGGGATGNDAHQTQSRSPGMSTKVGRRAAMHIARPHLVTVPLHMTANLAHGVLQGGGMDQVIQYGREREGADNTEGKDGRERKERKDREEKERKEEGGRIIKEGDESNGGGRKKREEKEEVCTGSVEETAEGNKEKETGEVARSEDQCKKPVQEVGIQGRGGEGGAENQKSVEDEEKDEGTGQDNGCMGEADVPEATVSVPDSPLSDTSVCGVEDASHVPDFFMSAELSKDDQGLSGYVQDNFDFLDHVDCSVSSQVNEFSVEPPFHEDNEYDTTEEDVPLAPPQAQPDPRLPNSSTPTPPAPKSQTKMPAKTHTHRPLGVDAHGRPAKSLSLPYMAPLFLPVPSSSEEEAEDEDEDEDEESSEEEDESIFYKSLPSTMFHNLTWSGPFTDDGDLSSPSPTVSPRLDRHAVNRISFDQPDSCEARKPVPLHSGSLVCEDERHEAQREGVHGGSVERAEESEEEQSQADTHKRKQSTKTEDAHHLADTSINEEDGHHAEKDRPKVSESQTDDVFTLALPETVHTEGKDTQACLKASDEGEMLAEHCHGDAEDSGGHHGDAENSGGHHGDAKDSGNHQGDAEDSGGHHGDAEDSGSNHCDAENSGGHHGDAEDSGGHHGDAEDSGGHHGDAEDSGGHHGNAEDSGGHHGNAEDSGCHHGDTSDEMNSSVVSFPMSCRFSCAAVKEIAGVSSESYRSPTDRTQITAMGDSVGDEDEVEEEKVDKRMEDSKGEGEVGPEVVEQVETEGNVLVVDMEENDERHPVKARGERERMASEEHNRTAQDTVSEQDEANREMRWEICDEFEGVRSERTEEEESKNGHRSDLRQETMAEGVVQDEVVKLGEQNETGSRDEEVRQKYFGSVSVVSNDGIWEPDGEAVIETEFKTGVHQESTTPEDEGQGSDSEELSSAGGRDFNSGDEKGCADITERNATEEIETMTRQEVRESEEVQQEVSANTVEKEDLRTGSEDKEPRDDQGDTDHRPEAGVGSVLVVSRQQPSKVHYAKAVPVVPPKPRHFRLTALNLRQHQQGGEWRDADREVGQDRSKEGDGDLKAGQQDSHGEEEDEGSSGKERQAHRGREREARRAGDEAGLRDRKRYSPISMCFDEAVAMATMKREKERGSGDREKQRERRFEV